MNSVDSSYAPIVVFAYNRPVHLSRTLEALAKNPEAAYSNLNIYCDGARTANDAGKVLQVREVAEGARGFASVRTITRAENLGLAKSIVAGVSEIALQAGSVIVLEDDLVTSRHFLGYMNANLARYADVPQVASIHGYSYPVDCALPETFFLRGADCWGWATWQRAWKMFEPDARKLLRELRQRGLVEDFDFRGTAGFMRMLEDFIDGKNDSWAVRWHASVYLRGMLTLYPGRSLVRNIGVDGTGTHSGDVDMFNDGVAEEPVKLEVIAIEENALVHAAFERFYRSLRPSLAQRLLRRIRRTLGWVAVTGAAR